MKKNVKSINKLQRKVFKTMLALIITMTVCITAISLYVNIRDEKRSLDSNLQNIAEALAQSPLVVKNLTAKSGSEAMKAGLDTLKSSLSNIDVISVVNNDGIRCYHTNMQLIGTVYDGTVPDFEKHNAFYVTSDLGPSGYQRRAYAQIVDETGKQVGFVLAVILNKNVHNIIRKTILIYLISAVAILSIALFLSRKLSIYIKNQLRGYEPDTFSSMFNIRDGILEALEEGIVAVGLRGDVVFANRAALAMLGVTDGSSDGAGTDGDTEPFLEAEAAEESALVPARHRKAVRRLLSEERLSEVLTRGEKLTNITIHLDNGNEILLNGIPVEEKGRVTGALLILVDRTEYTRMMEDLSGSKYLVESMRANNHDFTNKLHVILGLIQMKRLTEASEYITNITSIQQGVIHNIMVDIDDPSVAALLIGKYARAVELNIRFSVKTGSCYRRDDISILQGDLVTIIGNLLENAMDSLNTKDSFVKELSIGINTTPGALIITVDDTGCGMTPEVREHIFENHFSTKEGSRGTGLYIVSRLVEKYNGVIEVESEPDEGTSFVVRITAGNGR